MTETADAPVIQVDAKTAAKLFKQYSAPYVHGPFGPPTPPTVQQAIDKLGLWSTLIGDKPQIVVVANQLKSSSSHTSFTADDMRINAGDVYASDVACVDGTPEQDVTDLLNYIQARHEKPLWVEIYEEDAFMRRVMSDGEFAYRGTKINAYGDLTGMYYRPWPTIATAETPVVAHDSATLTCIDHGFISAAECEAVLEELRNFAAWWSAFSGAKVWADHYSTYNKRNTWSAFSLRGFEPQDPTSIVKPQEMPRDWKKEHAELLDAECADTIALGHFSTVQNILRKMVAFGYAQNFERVRLMRLSANGGELTRHADSTDHMAGTKDGYVSRLHIPLVTSEAVQFQAWDHRGRRFQRHLSARDLWYLDMRKPHAAVNKGNAERVHLVIDVVASESFRKQLADAHIDEISRGTHGLQFDPLR